MELRGGFVCLIKGSRWSGKWELFPESRRLVSAINEREDRRMSCEAKEIELGKIRRDW